MKRGAEFEKEVIRRAALYEKERLLVLRKVDPPTRIIGKAKIIYLPNPFLDFVGSYTEAGGRAIFIEAKQTDGDKLGIGSSNSSGVTVKQLHALRVWSASGAIAAVLWKTPNAIWFVPIEAIESMMYKTQTKRIAEADLPKFCFCGNTVKSIKLLSTMRRIYGVPAKASAHTVRCRA